MYNPRILPQNSMFILSLINKHYDLQGMLLKIKDEINYTNITQEQMGELLCANYELFKDKIPTSLWCGRHNSFVTRPPYRNLIVTHPSIMKTMTKQLLRDAYTWTEFDKSGNTSFLKHVDFAGMNQYDQYKMISHFKLETILEYHSVTDFKYTTVTDLLIINVGYTSQQVCENTPSGCEENLMRWKPFFDRFSGNVWKELLTHRYKRISNAAYKHCRWDKISSTGMVDLVCMDKNKYEQYLKLDKLTKSSWKRLIAKYPEYNDTMEHFEHQLKKNVTRKG